MKKVIQAICSVFFVTTLSLPVDVLANNAEEFQEAIKEQSVETTESDDYHLAFLSGDVDLQFSRSRMADQFDTLVMFISNPNGKVVKDAQVVTTIIDQNGDQLMRRARPLKGGYLIDTAHLTSGPYRLEVEVVKDGWLLTDEFFFQKV